MKFAHFSHAWKKPDMTPAARYQQLWRELELADELGYDYAFSVEHHFTPNESWMPVPSLYCTAAGMKTRRIRLGAMGHVIPLHHPIRLAEEIAVTDQILDGRLEVGIVPGIRPTYFGPYQADYQTRRPRTLEFVAFLRAAYTNADHFEFDGDYYHFKDVKLSVNPIQKPHPPLWLETRDPATLEFCAKEGLNTGYFLLLPREEAAPRYRKYLELWEQSGWTHKPRIAYSTVTYVDETDAKARERSRAHMAVAYKGLFNAEGKANDGPALEAEQQRQVRFFQQRGENSAAEIVQHVLDPDYLRSRDLVLVGSPDTVAKRLRKMASEGLFNTFFAELNFGGLPEEDLMRSIKLFGTEVIPQLRDFEPF